jgi:osmoprotectant transport system substrate-binding protein
MTPSWGRALVTSAIGLLLALTGCSGGDAGRGSRSSGAAVRVGSFDFAESKLLGELYAQAIERAGIPVTRHIGLGAREEVEPALEQGAVDLVPEYTGTALTFLDGGGHRATADAEGTYRLLQAAFATRGVTTYATSPAADQNALAVSRATADGLRLQRVSDLSPVSPTLVLGGPPECPQRQFCLPGLEARYGLRFKSFVPLDAGGPLTVGALQGNEIDVALLFTTTPEVDTAGFVLLEDDLGLQPAENVVPVVRSSVAGRYGDPLAASVDAVSAQLTSADLRGLNHQVAVEGRTPAAAARAWLDRHPARR